MSGYRVLGRAFDLYLVAALTRFEARHQLANKHRVEFALPASILSPTPDRGKGYHRSSQDMPASKTRWRAAANPPSTNGYTLLWAGVSNAINASIFSDLSFDFLKDIAPVSGAVAYPLVIEVNPKVPAKNIAELIALAKASPGKLTLASYGTGTISQVAGELFKLRAGIEMVHVPYKGEVDASQKAI